ncbi:hypothetical protein ACFWP7_34190 [Streptomyces sp. NPDC058470]|uniref:hypothetical protein n=1 Tax=Streptomyces sp. NPDC058470 TaxID=3346515 RepID=UPI0036668FA5
MKPPAQWACAGPTVVHGTTTTGLTLRAPRLKGPDGLARDLRITETRPAGWVCRAHRADGAGPSGEREELARLRRENTRLKKAGTRWRQRLWDSRCCSPLL